MERYNGRLIAYSLGNFATYYGISVAGIKGIAPILVVTLDGDGRFVEGEIVSTRQIRPAGPSIDPGQRALDMTRSLSKQDFGEPGLEFAADGRLLPADRAPVERRNFDPDTEGDGGPIPCTEPWFWQVVSVLGTDDDVGVESDFESTRWKSHVEARLGLKEARQQPQVGGPGWCAFIDEKLQGRF